MIRKPRNYSGAFCFIYTTGKKAKNVLSLVSPNCGAMKKNLFYLLAPFLLVFSCKKSDTSPALAGIITKGKWKVSLMKDNGHDVTPAYDDWVFTFLPDKIVKVTDSIDSFTGHWQEDTTRKKFILNINSGKIELITISHEWDIVFKTPGSFTLKDNKLSPSKELQFIKLP
jgi:hypothetical protein